MNDFAPALQTVAAIGFRLVISVHWIWTSYYALTVGHDLAAVLFVSILAWDDAQQWPPLIGSIADAYTLRRFWGLFWHRLHVYSFRMLVPWDGTSASRQLSLRAQRFRGNLNSVWTFFLSAVCHALVNLLLHRRHFFLEELRFFLLNWAICSLEFVVGLVVPNLETTAKIKVLGYVWVLVVFICLVPAWQFPKLYHYLQYFWQ